ncbi:MAG: hypothetical protein AAF570_13690, partial [Bacteroidota bacterium]
RFQEESSEHELSTTDRHELASEASTVVKESTEFDFSVNVSADFGPWLEVETDTSYGKDKSKQSSTAKSSQFARETVNKAVRRVQESVRQRRVTTVSQRITETNLHELHNDSEDHTVGIYRWLNKKYDARVRTEGLRMMYEFTIPEPAAFHIFAEAKKLDSSFILEEPLAPVHRIINRRNFSGEEQADREVPLKASHLNESNYLIYGGQYKVADLAPPPVEEVLLMENYAKAITAVDEDSNYFQASDKLNFTIPDGYFPDQFLATGTIFRYGTVNSRVYVSVGNQNIYPQRLFLDDNPAVNRWVFEMITDLDFDHLKDARADAEMKELKAALFVDHARDIAMSMIVRCKRTDHAYRAWQIETFEKIMGAYFQLKADYEEKLRGFQFSQGVVIGGRNPLENKQIQEIELKKHCISLLTRSELDDFGAMRESAITSLDGRILAYPEIDREKARQQATEIQFLENAFEWKRMMYQFYPYFWSDKRNWITKRSIDSTDPNFREFLRAGAARVILAVRDEYKEAVATYLETGKISVSNTPITYGDSLFIDVVDALKEEQAQSTGEIIDEWTVTLPTNLVVLDHPDAIAEVERVFNVGEE